MQGKNINNILLSDAVIATAKKRGSMDVLSDGKVILEEIFSSDILYKHWIKYQKKYRYAEDISWDDLKKSVFKLWNMFKFKDRKN